MPMSLTSPVTGGAQTGFTLPTYTLATDVAPDLNGKQWVVSALGGTQAGVTIHSPQSPFSALLTKPKQLKQLPNGTVANAIVRNIPMNRYSNVYRKGMTPGVGYVPATGMIRIYADIPAGCDQNDPANIRALFSLAQGGLAQLGATFADSAISGTL